MALDMTQCAPREVEADVTLAGGSDQKKQYAHPAPDLEHPARSKRRDELRQIPLGHYASNRLNGAKIFRLYIRRAQHDAEFVLHEGNDVDELSRCQKSLFHQHVVVGYLGGKAELLNHVPPQRRLYVAKGW